MLAQHEQIVKSSIYHYSENSGYDPRRWRRHEVDQLTYTDYRNESPVRFFHAFKKAKTAENLDGFSGQTIYTPLLFSGSRGFVLFEAQKDKKISHYPAFTRRFMFCTAAFRKHCSRMFLIPSKRAQRRPWFFSPPQRIFQLSLFSSYIRQRKARLITQMGGTLNRLHSPIWIIPMATKLM